VVEEERQLLIHQAVVAAVQVDLEPELLYQ
jgi:hypothetical protein